MTVAEKVKGRAGRPPYYGKPALEALTFRLPPKFLKKLRHRAIDEDTTLQALAIQAFAEFLGESVG